MALLLAPAADNAFANGKAVRPSGAKTAKKRQTKAKTRAKARFSFRARAKTKTSKTKLKNGSRIRGLFRSGKAKSKSKAKKGPGMFTKRQLIRDRQKQAKQQRSFGQINAAAKTVTASTTRDKGRFIKGGIKKLTIRERFAMWRAARSVRKAAFKTAKQRAKVGDAQGTQDSLSALKTLEAGGKLGMVRRWQARRAQKKAFKRISKAARKALKNGDLQGAGELQAFATGLRPGTRAARSQQKKLAKASWKLAKKYAKAGNPDASMQAMQMSAEMHQVAGAKFNEKKARKIVDSSFAKAGKALLREANAAYRQRDFNGAAQKVVELNAILNSGMKVKFGFRARRSMRKLTRKLGPRVEDVRQAMEAQQQGALAAQ